MIMIATTVEVLSVTSFVLIFHAEATTLLLYTCILLQHGAKQHTSIVQYGYRTESRRPLRVSS